MAFKIDAKGVPDTDHAVVTAREVLRAIDFEDLPIDQSLLTENRAQAAADLEQRGTQVDADADAISKSVAITVLDGVRDRGLDPGHVTIGGDRYCGHDEGSRSDGN
ncbi:hypothetical protein EV187_1131 [Agromyces ramosus]|uniref:Uncharacterized protein n=1 Tax=Agromyces ramosus TaxID=33879 RepID=A0A4Q7MK95_9MICO|nr:hypothetical protein [Agromyces ramosus]RZS68696.1 hypothetical protein EV187_1131 [Agromyces ramosus]